MNTIPADAGSRNGSGARQPLVMFAPYPPAMNGIAAYVGELMPYLLADFDITLVIADDADAPVEGRHCPRVLLASEFRRNRAYFEQAPKLYHVGNNPDHCYMLDFLARDPGIVVLHDFNLNYMHEVATRGWQQRPGYLSALELEYGALGAESTRSRFERRDRGQFATYELPLNGDVLEAATGVIAHSRYVQYRVAARVPRIPVWYVPHHLSPELARYGQITKAEARRDLGLPDNEIIITAPGFITFAKRIPMLLEALATLRPRLPPFRLVFAGERCPDQYDVDADVAASGLKGFATCTGYLDDAEFFKHLAACDVVANLRHPSGGETSGTLIRALGMGAPVIVFDHGPIGELPESVVRKVPWGSNTRSALAMALYELISSRTQRLALGARAAAYARHVHGIEKSSQRYADIIRSCANIAACNDAKMIKDHFPHPKAVARRLRQAGNKLSPADIGHVDGRWWWRCAKAPLGEPGRRALVLAPNPSATAEFMALAFAWRTADVSAMTVDEFLGPHLREENGAPIQQGTFSFALVIAPVDLPEIRAATLLRRLNAALRRGGSVAFEVWCPIEKESRDEPLAESRVEQRLIDAGFAEVSPVSPRDGFFADMLSLSPNGQQERRYVCFTARKASSFVLWRFMAEVEGAPLCFGGLIN